MEFDIHLPHHFLSFLECVMGARRVCLLLLRHRVCHPTRFLSGPKGELRSSVRALVPCTDGALRAQTEQRRAGRGRSRLLRAGLVLAFRRGQCGGQAHRSLRVLAAPPEREGDAAAPRGS